MSATSEPSEKLAVVARIKAKAGERDKMLAALRSLVEAADSETGTESYIVHEALDDSDVVWVYELYENDAALDVHASSSAMAEIAGALAGLVAEAPQLNLARPVHASGVTI